MECEYSTCTNIGAVSCSKCGKLVCGRHFRNKEGMCRACYDLDIAIKGALVILGCIIIAVWQLFSGNIQAFLGFLGFGAFIFLATMMQWRKWKVAHSNSRLKAEVRMSQNNYSETN